MQIESSHNTSNSFADKRSDRMAHDKQPTAERQSHSNTVKVQPRSLGEIVTSLRSDLAMELPQHPGFTSGSNGQNQDVNSSATLQPQQQSDTASSDRDSVSDASEQRELSGADVAGGPVEERQPPPQAPDQASNSDSGGQIIDEVA